MELSILARSLPCLIVRHNQQIGKQEYEELLRRDLTAEKNDLNVEGGEKQ